MNSFNINGQQFNIILTAHAELRLSQRNIDLFQAIGSILSLGQDKIIEYKDSNKDLMIIDKVNNFSVCANVTANEITIITAIDNSDVWIKDGTTAVQL